MENQLNEANKILGTNYGDWYEVSEHEGLTEDFIREFRDKVDWEGIIKMQHISKSLIEEVIVNKLDRELLLLEMETLDDLNKLLYPTK